MGQQKRKVYTLRKFVGKLHLILGLSSGIIVCFLAITGCLLSFQKEIEATQSYRYVAALKAQEPLQPSLLQKKAVAALPGKKLHSISYQKGHAAVASFFYNNPRYYYLVFLNPYTGEVIKVKDMSLDFFRFVVTGHFYLWLPASIGQPIVASATLVFVVMLVSGIILWWPKNKAAMKQRFKVKWDASRKRLNYDLHNTFGFYACLLALLLATTGLVWGFKWFAQGTYFLSSGGKSLPVFQLPLSDTNVVSKQTLSSAIDTIWQQKIGTIEQNATSVEVHFPEDKASSIELAVNPDVGTYWKTDYYYYDQNTLQEQEVKHQYGKLKNAAFADQLSRMNYDLHVGAIAGLGGKIAMFLTSLVCASLPITGFMIWNGRRKKKRRKQVL